MEPQKLTDSEKIDLLLCKVNRLERHIIPPRWKQILSWIINHFWTLAALIFILIAVWNIWEIVTNVQEFLESWKGNFSDVENKVRGFFGR